MNADDAAKDPKERHDEAVRLSDGKRWLQDKKVSPLLVQLVEELLAARPNDVLRFIHEWSDPSSSRGNSSEVLGSKDASSSSDCVQPHGAGSCALPAPALCLGEPCAAMAENRASCGDAPRARGDGGSEPSPKKQEVDPRHEEDLLPCEEYSEEEKEKEKEEGNRDYYDEEQGEEAEESEDEGPQADELCRRFPPPPAGEELVVENDRHIGTGNYGKVVLGWMTEDRTSLPASSEMSRMTQKKKIRVAVKKVVVRRHWHLDEVSNLEAITTHSVDALKALQEAIPLKLDESIFAYRCRVLQTIAFPRKSVGHQHHVDVDEVMSAGPITAAAAQVARSLLGAWCVATLVRPCFFCPAAGELLLPMQFIPYPLDAIVAKRLLHRKKCMTKRTDAVASVETGEEEMPLTLSQSPLLTTEEIRNVARQLVLGLVFLSERCGKVHLDMKPANILVQFDTEAADSSSICSFSSPVGDSAWHLRSLTGARVAMCDFGLTQDIGASILQLGDFFYMAPEVFYRGHGVSKSRAEKGDEDEDFRDETDPEDDAITESDRHELGHFCATHDVWSLGCCLLFMIDGIAAFSWKETDCFQMMRENYVTPMPKHTQAVDPILLSFIAVCLERDWKRRPLPRELCKHPFLAGSSFNY
jgi:hypothetical protein